MKRFITTIKNIFSIEELRNRIYYTLGFLLIFRLGSYIVLPGIDPTKLVDNTEGVFGMLNVFLGGAFSRASIFALGIMPYISASIVVQLLQIAIPYFQRMQKEGESGRKRINQIIRVLTIVITLAQATGYLATNVPSDAIMTSAISQSFFYISSAIILCAGTIFCMWIGEKITERGIGNGISMLIMINIVSSLPIAIVEEFTSRAATSGLFVFIAELIALFFVVMGVILLIQAVRKIHVQYARQVVGSNTKQVAQGQRSYIPIKVNSANVMPIIFAQALMFLPSLVAGFWADTSDVAAYVQQAYSSYTTWQYCLTFALLIIIFSYFYTAITINSQQMAEDMKRNGAFIPGVKPGEDTAEYIGTVVDRITLPGALFLALVAIMPAFVSLANVNANFANFFGGTSIIIMVGVILDTLQQIESYLLMRHYDGMLKSGKIRGRSQNVAVAE